MRNPLIDVIACGLLIPSLQVANWLLQQQPHVQALVTYSALLGLVWRGVVLIRRWQQRRKDRMRPKKRWFKI